jgi:hypothetical protein
MKFIPIRYATVILTLCLFGAAYAAPEPKAKAKAKAEELTKEPAKRDTYPLYGKVVAVSARLLTVVRSDNPEAKESKYAINTATEFVNGEKAATVDDVKVGKWVGGTLKKAEGDGNDTVVKINVAVKQKEAVKPSESKGAKGESKSPTKKKAA